MEIDDSICYDIQMVGSNMIKKSVLRDYDFPIDESKVTWDNLERCCPHCPFNQLQQSAEPIPVIAGEGG
jgi:hypothetical protein